MNLRGCKAILRGKVVGREGVEPSTKRLRVGDHKALPLHESAGAPLSLSRSNIEWRPDSGGGLRGSQ